MLGTDGTYLDEEDANEDLVYRKRRQQVREAMVPKSAHESYMEYLKNLSHLSATTLEDHIKQKHPTRINPETEEYGNWSICEDVGSLLNFNCCVKRRVTRVQRSLGVGPSLYLLSLKSFIQLLVLICLLATP